jgi:hypothetical protein
MIEPPKKRSKNHNYLSTLIILASNHFVQVILPHQVDRFIFDPFSGTTVAQR